MIQMLGIGRVILVACLCSFSAAAFGYTAADVKRGQDMVAGADYKGAIELLSGITKDFEFCAANPADAAKAGILLCDAYEGSGEKSDAYKAAAELTKVALVQMWASLKKEDPDVKKRFGKMGQICVGHPQALAEFLKSVLPRLIATGSEAEAPAYLDSALAVYRQVVATVPGGKAVPDSDLLLQNW